MSNEHSFDEKSKVRRKRKEEKKDHQKSTDNPAAPQIQGKLDANAVTRLQQTAGNAAVQRLLAQRKGNGPSELDEETADHIRREQGQGQKLDADIANEVGDVTGEDYDDVTVHTDGKADQLSRKVGAKAFTTGKDIFFREGEYNPHSRDGQRLISHELTHVTQQDQNTPSVQGKLTVNDPNDKYEAEADKVADMVTGQSHNATDLQRQLPEEELQMQPAEEEELQMQPAEEEELQMQSVEEEELQKQPEEEEELQRQSAPDEEELQAKRKM